MSRTRKRDGAALQPERTAEQRAALDRLLSRGKGPYTMSDLLNARPELEPVVAEHATCGHVPMTWTAKVAARVVTEGPPALRQFITGPDGPISADQAAAVLHVNPAEIRALTEHQSATVIRHRMVDAWLATQAQDPVVFANLIATARTEAQTRRAQATAERAEERARKDTVNTAANEARERLGLPAARHHAHQIRTVDAATALGLSQAQVRTAITAGHLPGEQVVVSTNHGRNTLWMVNVHALEEAKANPPAWLERATDRAGRAAQVRATRLVQAREAEAAERQREREARALAEASVNVRLPVRTREPLTMHAHLGPTNSGKTHDALDALARSGHGVYAAPLRALAVEVHDRLAERLGAENVGLVTGEEQINPDAPIICVTAECAPLTATTLVIDEAHWVADPQRGWAWTRLLAGATVDHLVVIGASEIAPLLRTALGPNLTITNHERLTNLTYRGTIQLRQVQAGSLVVAFSRKAVLALARTLQDATGHPVGVLYGAMPPAARRASIAAFLTGSTPIMVVTDVIGHGINLPAAHVVMAETTKYDGSTRRPLHLWEAAQIVGRAGRFAMAGDGSVATLDVPALTADTKLVSAATAVGAGRRASGLRVTYGELRPTLTDLGCGNTLDLPAHLTAWHDLAEKALASHEWLRAFPVTPLLYRLDIIGATQLRDLTLHDAWSLVTLPVDDPDTIQLFARAVLGRARLSLPDPVTVSLTDLLTAERTASYARDVMAFTRVFGDRAGVNARDAAVVEVAAAQRIIECLAEEVTRNTFGICRACQRPCPPWFDRCERCHHTPTADNEWD